MCRKAAVFLVILSGVLVGAPAFASDQGAVQAGAFCSSVGDTGHTAAGSALVCAITDAQGHPYTQPRWRSVSVATAQSSAPVAATVQAPTRARSLAFSGSYVAYLAAAALMLIVVGVSLTMKQPLRDVRSRWY
jgi:hypothetical protein